MTSIRYPRTALCALLALAAGCEAGAARSAGSRLEPAAAVARVSAQTVQADTGIAQATLRAMAEFRATVSGPVPVRPGAASPSMDALVARFVEALESADTAALIAMTMSRGEFIALHYPHSIYVRPPYELGPGDVWLLSRAQTEKGLTRLLQRFGGQPFGFVRYDCPDPPKREGPNRWWSGCTITRRLHGAPHTMRYFASIWERDGAFKFGGYANDL